ncbi:hypothetical protein B5G04_14385 [Bacteroides sp. An51A]|nr:hypothetical protein B5G04_14385 [Bacteroides sp. An51A]OUP32930.1 hypothetical protein B5F25_08160 [Bacteroides sp. An19]
MPQKLIPNHRTINSKQLLIFYQVLLRLFPVCFPDFIRQIARYPPHKIRKTSSKTIRKINLSKI